MSSPRSSLGGVWLSLRQQYGRGLKTAYYRDRVRPKILSTAPVDCDAGGLCEIHVLTSSSDWLNLVWALKSFYFFARRSYRLCIHDDGSLSSESVATLSRHFPGARIVSRPQSDLEVEKALLLYPRCLQLRRSNHLSPKLFDFAYYLTTPRMLLLDSDILFFAQPTELLRRVEDPEYLFNSVNADISSAYTVSPEAAQQICGIELQDKFNSGLGVIHQKSLNFDWIEEFLGMPGIEGHFWRIEQTIYALCSSRFGTELLPEEYAVRLEGGLQNAPCRHYIGAIRHLMYREGIRHLVKHRFMELIS